MKETVYWKLYDDNCNESVIRYCHNCGKKVVFQDSQKRRQNANGKNIYEYAIYKCEKDHTWNLLLNQYKSIDGTNTTSDQSTLKQNSVYTDINLWELDHQGIDEFEIIIEEVSGKWRIDKLLSDRIKNISRTKICELIKKEKVLINHKSVKPCTTIKQNQKITLFIKALLIVN